MTDVARAQQQVEPCTRCGRAVNCMHACGIHLRTGSVFCVRCAVLFELTAPRKAIAS